MDPEDKVSPYPYTPYWVLITILPCNGVCVGEKQREFGYTISSLQPARREQRRLATQNRVLHVFVTGHKP